MKITFFRNPRAGDSSFKASSIVRILEARGHNVLYKSIKDANWREAFAEPMDRAILAGGDGTVSRLAPWLAARNVPFCILPLGTANNCARGLGQMHIVEEVVANFDSACLPESTSAYSRVR